MNKLITCWLVLWFWFWRFWFRWPSRPRRARSSRRRRRFFGFWTRPWTPFWGRFRLLHWLFENLVVFSKREFWAWAASFQLRLFWISFAFWDRRSRINWFCFINRLFNSLRVLEFWFLETTLLKFFLKFGISELNGNLIILCLPLSCCPIVVPC